MKQKSSYQEVHVLAWLQEQKEVGMNVQTVPPLLESQVDWQWGMPLLGVETLVQSPS